MSREEIQKLLGGYATGTLTAQEQQTLFAAALDDQELFDALAREQSLRDLLRDPAAKAQVLAALDTPPARRWYQAGWWRPAAVAVAMAGVAVLAVVVMRQNSRPPQLAMEVKTEAPATPEFRAPEPAPVSAPSAAVDALSKPRARRKSSPEANNQRAKIENPPIQREMSSSPAPAVAPAAPAPEQKAEGVQQAQALPPPPQSGPAPTSQSQQTGVLGGLAGGTAGSLDTRFPTLNARALFYGTPFAAVAGSGRQDAVRPRASANSAPANTMMKAVSPMVPPAPNLGVRCSILRRQANGEFVEAGLESVLDSGEAVKLKLVPNDSGYLFVWTAAPNGGMRALTSGPAERLKEFETPALEYEAAGQRQLYVEFTRNSPPGFGGAPSQALVTQARANLIQTAAEVPERATYVVNRATGPAAQRLIVPITLNYK